MRIFLVVAEDFSSTLYEGILKQDGHSVMRVSDLDDSLHFFKDFNPDLLLIEEECLDENSFASSVSQYRNVSSIPFIGVLNQEDSTYSSVFDVIWTRPIKLENLLDQLKELL